MSEKNMKIYIQIFYIGCKFTKNCSKTSIAQCATSEKYTD